VGQPQKVAGKRNEAVRTTIPIAILPGYHVNSNKPSEDYLIPLALKWTSMGALQGGEVTYPKPAMEKYDFAEKPLSVYTGNISLTVNFKVGPSAAAGPGVATGKLSYQACNSNTCFPPKTVEVTVPYQIN
jgi:thiol:disulfide interchange protein DsbD